MSTTLLYNMFGIRGYEYRWTDYFEGAACFTVEQPRHRYRCSECGSAAVNAQGHKERLLRCLPIGGKPTFVLVKVPRVVCFHCELTRQVKVPFAHPRRSYTHAFERYVIQKIDRELSSTQLKGSSLVGFQLCKEKSSMSSPVPGTTSRAFAARRGCSLRAVRA